MEPHSSTLAWKIPWAEEPGRLQSIGSLRVRHNIPLLLKGNIQRIKKKKKNLSDVKNDRRKNLINGRTGKESKAL